MVTLVDMDGILCDVMTPWLDGIYKKTGVRAQLEDVKRWGIESCAPLDRVPKADIFSVIDESGFMSALKPIPGALDGFREIWDRGETYITTARHARNALPETRDWIEAYLPYVNFAREVIFIHAKWLIAADVIIDDKGETLAEYHVMHPHARCIGLRYPYNAWLNEPWANLEKDWPALLKTLEF